MFPVFSDFPTPSVEEILATSILVLAVLHIFIADRFHQMGSRSRPGSARENFFHLLGEVEVVMGFWAGVFVLIFGLMYGQEKVVHYLNNLHFSEPVFVFAVMAVAATRPLLSSARYLLASLSDFVFVLIQSIIKNINIKLLSSVKLKGKSIALVAPSRSLLFYAICLSIGPLMGSLITEPAAMTLIALMMKDVFFANHVSTRLKYRALATLFVNISIGGVLTHFAAPPILMVAKAWGWKTPEVFSLLGWKAVCAVFINVFFAIIIDRKELQELDMPKAEGGHRSNRMTSLSLTLIHLLFLISIVFVSSVPVIVLGLFLFFTGFVSITREHQDELRLRESLLVAFFLGGLIVLGGLQTWWLSPLIQSLSDTTLFLGTALLTTVMDNAALTYLGSQIPSITGGQKYLLVAGAVAAGGMTVMANAPNPAGYSILQENFGERGIQPFRLAVYAFVPTMLAMLIFLLL